MIRFEPDSLWQALMRFFDMAAPDANIYVEIPAPDVRFAAIVLLTLAAIVLWRRLGPGRNATFALLAVLLASTALWLSTTGNGRYFVGMLVCAGPIAIALVCLLPIVRGYKMLLAGLLVAVQAFVLSQQPPWSAWTVMHWTKGPYFDVTVPPEEKTGPPTTYASLPILTYSLIAPQFPPQTRWINLHTTGVSERDRNWSEDFLREAAAEGPLKLLVPSMPAATLPDGRPNADMVAVFNRAVASRNLRVSGTCGHIPAPGLERMVEEREGKTDGPAPRLGFWTCPLAYQPGLWRPEKQPVPPEAVVQAYAKLGELCPRFFPPNESHLQRLSDGWVRGYTTQTRAYVLDNGQVWYRFWRALNAVQVGTTSDLLAGKAKLDCLGVRNDGAWRTGAN